MNLHRLGRAAAFVAGSIVGGLALAFVIVFLRPQLLSSRPRCRQRIAKRRSQWRRAAGADRDPGCPEQSGRGRRPPAATIRAGAGSSGGGQPGAGRDRIVCRGGGCAPLPRW